MDNIKPDQSLSDGKKDIPQKIEDGKGVVGELGNDNKREVKPKGWNLAKHSKETWIKVRADFDSFNYTSLKELAKKHGIHHSTMTCRMAREGWIKEREATLSKIKREVDKKVVKELSIQEDYLKSSFSRVKKYEKIIDASLAQMGQDSEGNPLVEPETIDSLTRSETRLHEMAKSALRIIPISQVDHTSHGQSLGESFVSAIAKLRNSKDFVKPSETDLKGVLKAEIVD